MKGFMKYYGKRIVWYVITLVVAVFLGISTMRQRALNFWIWCRAKIGEKGGRSNA